MKHDSTNTFLTVVSLAMFSVTSVLVGLLVCSPDDAPQPECNLDGSEPRCEDGWICAEAGFCVEPNESRASPPACLDGQNILGCTCDRPFLAVDGVCRKPSEAEACRQPEVTELLARLDRACAGDSTPGRLAGCSEEALRDVVLGNHRQILDIARVFADSSFTLHFRHGSPLRSGTTRWPSTADRPRVVGFINRMLGDAEPRGYLLLVALASPTGTHELNYELASRRSDVAVALVEQARRDFKELGKRLRDVQSLVGLVGNDANFALDLEQFAEIWGRSGRYRAWDESQTRRMTALLEQRKDRTISKADEQWLLRVVNQSVVAIPLPCATPEAHG